MLNVLLVLGYLSCCGWNGFGLLDGGQAYRRQGINSRLLVHVCEFYIGKNRIIIKEINKNLGLNSKLDAQPLLTPYCRRI